MTAEAVRQARQAIRRLERERPDARIVVTGCAAQTEPQTFAAMPEVDRVLGNDEKMQRRVLAPSTRDVLRASAVRARRRGESPSSTTSWRCARPRRISIDGIDGRARAFVQVQNGCDHRCTFCIIPYGRGNSRSVPMGEVVAQVRRLVEHGYREVVLTGVDLTSYGADLPGAPRLGTLVKQILKHVPELARLRLSSIDSVEADRDLLDALADEPRLMPHLHLSLQAGDDLILKRMKRRHLARRRDRVLRPGAAAAARHRVRRRHHRGLPDRDRGDVRALARSRRRMRPHASARVSVLAAARHAGRAHAAGAARDASRSARGALREKGAAALRAPSRRRDRRAAPRADGVATTSAAPSSSRRCGSRAPAEPGVIVEVTIAGHDGRQLLAA